MFFCFLIFQEHVNQLNAAGAKLVGFEDFTTPVHAITPEQMSGIYDLIILLCKQTANPEAFKTIRNYMDQNSTILTLQNGIPEPSIAEVFGEERVLGGAIAWVQHSSAPVFQKLRNP